MPFRGGAGQRQRRQISVQETRCVGPSGLVEEWMRWWMRLDLNGGVPEKRARPKE